MPQATPQYCPIPWTACIEASGADAEAFLRGQLSRNPPGPAADRSVPAAWHDARGRVRALFRLIALHDSWLLVAERDAVDSVLAKLRMFVLRAKVQVAATDAWHVAAVLGNSAAWLAARDVELAADANALARAGTVLWLRGAPHLLYVVGPAAELEALAADLEPAAPELAELAEIRAGLPRVPPALEQRYLPQMLNLDRLDAIAFDKGCYPGQEVIARLHNLGTVKRRMHRFRCATASIAPSPGTQVVDASGEGVGEVVRAARVDDGIELLAVVQLDALAAALFLDGDRKMPLVLEGLPYEHG